MSIADYGFAIWETFYVTVLSTAFALVLGLAEPYLFPSQDGTEEYTGGNAVSCAKK